MFLVCAYDESERLIYSRHVALIDPDRPHAFAEALYIAQSDMASHQSRVRRWSVTLALYSDAGGV